MSVRRQQVFNDAPPRIKALALLLVVNWALCFVISWSVGGTALYGEIENGAFLVRRGVSAEPIEVSREFWAFSLFHTLFTVGGTFLAIAILFVLSRPRWDRGVTDVIAVAATTLVLLLAVLYSLPRIVAWAAV